MAGELTGTKRHDQTHLPPEWIREPGEVGQAVGPGPRVDPRPAQRWGWLMTAVASTEPSALSRRTLARTGWLDLYDAWSAERDCRCVVKALRPDRRHEEQMRDRLLREGRWLRTFTHPHLVRAYETFESPEPLVVLEKLTGETLSHLIDRLRRRPVGTWPSSVCICVPRYIPPRSRPAASGPQAVQRRFRLRARQSARPSPSSVASGTQSSRVRSGRSRCQTG